MEETHTLSHTTWNCKYHVVFAPKYRRQVFYGEKRQDCEWQTVHALLSATSNMRARPVL